MLVTTVVVLLGDHDAAKGINNTTCAAAPTVPSLEFTYRLGAGKKKVTPRTRRAAMVIVCKRLQTILKTDGQVQAVTDRRIRVILPQVGGVGYTQRAAEQIGEPGRLYFYDWEPNLIGSEQKIGGHPGEMPPAAALRRANREWHAAGRDVSQPANARLISAGAFPSAYGAIKLASEQKPRKRCPACSASTPRFYVFGRSAAHKLVAGPFSDRAELHSAVSQRRPHNYIVLKVPVGTTIVSEPPVSRSGETIATAEPGWFALKDRPALNGLDIVRPNQEVNEVGRPTVTFGFTGKGRTAFERLTRKIVRRGRAAAIGPVGGYGAEALSGHFATVFDDEVKTRPIINFADFPNGIDGRIGAQISGGFPNIRAAQDFATILKIGFLPINMVLTRKQILQPTHSPQRARLRNSDG
jgi:SecD/SecF fusion protein